MKDNLQFEIGRKLAIPRKKGEEWKSHTIFSLAGKMMLASLWDRDGKFEYISRQHFIQRGKQIFEAYLNINPEVRTYFPEDKTEVLNEIYSVYLRTGFFYHTPDRLYPCAPTQAQVNNVMLHRGFAPGEVFNMSGLGFYSINSPKSPTATVSQMFCLREQALEEYLEEVIREPGEWTAVQWPASTEFLRMEPPFHSGYWQNRPNKDGRVGLARYGETSKVFTFYRYERGEPKQKIIPQWRIKDFRSDSQGIHNDYSGYRRIASALLDSYGTLPSILVKPAGEVVEVRIGYALPPEETDFLRLYSWPTVYHYFPQMFVRYMAAPIYPIFKLNLERMGYSFKEG